MSNPVSINSIPLLVELVGKLVDTITTKFEYFQCKLNTLIKRSNVCERRLKTIVKASFAGQNGDQIKQPQKQGKQHSFKEYRDTNLLAPDIKEAIPPGKIKSASESIKEPIPTKSAFHLMILELKENSEDGTEEAVLVGRVMAKGVSEELVRCVLEKAIEDSHVFRMGSILWPLF